MLRLERAGVVIPRVGSFRWAVNLDGITPLPDASLPSIVGFRAVNSEVCTSAISPRSRMSRNDPSIRACGSSGLEAVSDQNEAIDKKTSQNGCR